MLSLFVTILWSYLVLPECSWVWDHLLGHGSPFRTCMPKENWQTLPKKLSVDNSPSDSGGISWASDTPMLGFCLTWSCISLVHTVSAYATLYVQLCCHVQQMLFPYRHLCPVVLTVFWFLFCNDPSALGEEGMIEMSHLESGIPVSYSLHLDSSWVSVLVDINKQKEASLTKVESCITYGCKDKNLGAVYY